MAVDDDGVIGRGSALGSGATADRTAQEHAALFAEAFKAALKDIDEADLEIVLEAYRQENRRPTFDVKYSIDLEIGSVEAVRYHAKIQVADWPL
jgi:hypothetical protein